VELRETVAQRRVDPVDDLLGTGQHAWLHFVEFTDVAAPVTTAVRPSSYYIPMVYSPATAETSQPAAPSVTPISGS
jgi:hypothetical protein